MNKKVVIGIVIIALLVIIGLFFKAPKNSYQETQSVVSSTASTTQYSLVDVAKHASALSCWTTISGKVYDLTPWMAEHPGGEQAILGLCGIDGTQAFTSEHGGQRRPESELAKYLVGSLIQ